MSLPDIAAIAILAAIWIWNERASALGLTFANARTITVTVAASFGYASINWGPRCAASIVATLPMVLFAMLAQRSTVNHLTVGTVKG